MMNSFFKYIVVIVFVFSGYEVFSQVPRSSFRSGSSLRKVEDARDNYVINQLDLNEEQKAKFWPLYRQYHDEITDVRKLKRQNLNFNKSEDQMDKDAQYDQQLLDIKKRYNHEFAKIMPVRKINLIYQSEREFTKELFNQLGERGKPER
jgi:hypothetical protein